MSKVNTKPAPSLKERAKSALTVSGMSIAFAIILTQLFFQFFNKGIWAGLLTFIFAFPLFLLGIGLLITACVYAVKILWLKIKKS
jgi:hypothetical protein